MRPSHFFVLLVIGILALVVVQQIPIVNDWVNVNCAGGGTWCPNDGEFWSGVYSIWLVVALLVGGLRR